jgi:hypothetical protein
MKPGLSILLFFVFYSAAPAQTRLAGRVVDAQGRSVEYVNVGIEDTQTGVVSDKQGRFSLTIPDSLAGGTLFVSHITYEPRRIPLREVSGRAEEPLTIELSERAFEIPQVVVHGGRPRYRQIGRGVRAPLPHFPGMFSSSPEDDDLGWQEELGAALNVRDPLLVEEIRFPVEFCSDSLLLRFKIYQIEDVARFTLLHNTPFYALILPDRDNRIYTIDVSDVSEIPVVARPGTVLITVEKVDDYNKEISFWMPIYFGESYRRWGLNDGNLVKLPTYIRLGIELYGRVLPE